MTCAPHVWLTPANSINLGRLLPQVFYYFVLAGRGGHGSGGPIVSVPSGNFGNLTAGLIAKRIGLPIRHFVAATNVNDSVPVYLHSGHYEPRPSIRDGGQRDGCGRPEQFRAGAVPVQLGSDRAAPRRRRLRVWRREGGGRDHQRASASWLRARSAQRHRVAGAAGRARPRIRTRTGCFWRPRTRRSSGRSSSRRSDEPVPLPPEIADALSRPRQSISMPADYAALERFLRS